MNFVPWQGNELWLVNTNWGGENPEQNKSARTHTARGHGFILNFKSCP